MFEQAARLKLRFMTPKGNLGVEDLWDLPLTSKRGVSLEELAQDLYKRTEELPKVSFVSKVEPKDKEMELRFNIVKHIITKRLEENAGKVNDAQKKAHNQHILSLIEQKKNADLETKSVEELQAMLQQ